MKTRKLAASAATLSLAALLLLAGGIEAQKVETTARKRAPRAEFDPEQGKAGVSHFAEPPVVDEAFDRSIRANIPVLQAAKRSEKRFVDPDELYQRRLAMYEGRKSFNSSLSRTDSPEPGFGPDGRNETTRSKAKETPRLKLESDSLLPILLLAAVLVTGLAIYLGAFRKGSRSGS